MSKIKNWPTVLGDGAPRMFVAPVAKLNFDVGEPPGWALKSVCCLLNKACPWTEPPAL